MGRKCIFKVTFDKNRSSSMTPIPHNEVVYVVAKTRVLAKFVVMIVDEVKCIFMYLVLMNACFFKHCCTCGEQGWKGHGKKEFCVVLIDRGDAYRGGNQWKVVVGYLVCVTSV